MTMTHAISHGWKSPVRTLCLSVYVSLSLSLCLTKEVSAHFTQATELTKMMLKLLSECLTVLSNSQETMKRTVTSGNISGKPWFDLECIEKRRVVR